MDLTQQIMELSQNKIMKNKTLLKSFLALALMVTFSTQAYGSEVTGNLSSSTTQGSSVGDSSSEVSGTLSSGTIAGIVGNSGTISGSVTSGSTSSGGGSVRGASTTGQSSDPGQVLGATIAPGFPTTGIGYEVNLGAISIIGLILCFTAILVYVYRRQKINAEMD